MKLGRTIISSTLAIALTACGGGGGGGGGGGNTGSSGGGGGGGTTGCSLGERQEWTLGQLNEWYLFPGLLNKSVNPAAHQSVQSYIDALVAPARAEEKDRFFTYITSIQEENELINSGSNAGFGVRLSYDNANDRVFVVEAFENAPAFPAGIDRGTEILAINGQSVASLMQSGGAQAVSDALGPSEPGVSRTLRFRPVGAAEREVTIAKTEFSLDPISNRYGVRVFEADGLKIGYVNLRTFIVESAGPQLRDAFQRFQNEGVDQVILDLRYNGGGLISVADLLGDLLGRDKTGQVFSRTLFRDSKAANNETKLFAAQPQAIAASKIAVIGRGGTASASELVTNAFLPYLGANIGLIGANTFGKPVGQIALDRSACDDRLRAVALRTVNASNGGNYYRGLAPVMQMTCTAPDGIFTPLGDTDEASISVALDYLAGRSCSPITAAEKDGTIKGEAPERMLLTPRAPTAAQHEIPGLF